uniref:Uncharacterized protein n=1 Tax=Globodera rostochiensis TaxID=31243 RepID=A0A914I978_GLORO
MLLESQAQPHAYGFFAFNGESKKSQAGIDTLNSDPFRQPKQLQAAPLLQRARTLLITKKEEEKKIEEVYGTPWLILMTAKNRWNLSGPPCGSAPTESAMVEPRHRSPASVIAGTPQPGKFMKGRTANGQAMGESNVRWGAKGERKGEKRE